jgi:hypothetical protein
MSDETFSLLFEIYLVAGTTLLFLVLLNGRLRQRSVRFAQRFRPTFSETHALVTIIILLIVFVPLTVLSTFHRLGLLFPARPQ